MTNIHFDIRKYMETGLLKVIVRMRGDRLAIPKLSTYVNPWTIPDSNHLLQVGTTRAFSHLYFYLNNETFDNLPSSHSENA